MLENLKYKLKIEFKSNFLISIVRIKNIKKKTWRIT